jgi:anaerobic magnesium-protoporphyrin IX monomethyl ester cyclase
MSDGTASDVLLVTSPRPPWISPKAFEVSENSCPPLGLLYLARYLENAGVTVRVNDFYRFGGKPKDVIPLINESRPKIVAISTLTSGFSLAKRICRHVKENAPDVVTVIGGAHATALPREVLAEPDVDFVVRGEGELSLEELVRAVLEGETSSTSLSRIDGIGFKIGENAVLTSDRRLLDVDEIPEPARHLVPLDQYLQAGAILVSRGCPAHCFFCSSVSFNTHRYRFRSPSLVVSEIEGLHRAHGLTEFEFMDDVITSDPKRLRELCLKLQGRGFRWACQARIKDLEDDLGLLDAMAAGGCAGIFFGVEAGNDDVLRKVKGLTTAGVTKVVERAVANHLNVITSFMIGHPWDTRQTIEDTFNLMLRLRDLGCHTPMSILVPFPGSPLAQAPENFGIRIESRDYSDYYHNRALLTTQHLSREELREIYLDLLFRFTIDQEDIPTRQN